MRAVSGGARPPLSPRAAVALLAAVVVVWGANWPVMKVGLEDIPPLLFALARMLLGAACLFAVLAARGEVRLPGRADLPVVLSVGVLQLAAYLSLINLGLTEVEAGRSAILAYTTPIWVVPLAVIFMGERLTAGRLAGVALGVAGIAVLFNPLAFDWSDPAQLAGNALLLAASLAWAVAIVHVRGHRFECSPLQLAPWQMLLGAVPVAVLAVLLEDPAEIVPGPRLWAVLAYNGPFATAFALWAWITVNRALTAITTSMASLAIPAAGVVAAAVALGEAITPANAVGLALIAAGIAVIARAGARGAG